MNMSFYDLYLWLAGLDFPSLYAIWTWLITVPWWLAIFTVLFVTFALRLGWALGEISFNWLSDSMFEAGGWLRKVALAVKRYTSLTMEFCRSAKKNLFH